MLNSLLHTVFSIAFFIWLSVALIMELFKYALFYTWAGTAWIIDFVMTLGNCALRPIYWNWSAIDCDDLKFPQGFMWGVSTASHQVEGNCTNNNWSRWENLEREANKPPTIKGNQKAGDACDHWNRVEQDTQLIKNLGVGSYRFSIEWSKVEPLLGEIDREVLDHYHMEIDTLLANQIIPMVTLFHFSYPIWFEDLGAFEKKDNCEHFIRFSELMYTEFGSKVEWWCTINELEVFVSNAYFSGLFPPGKMGAMKLAGIVLKNLLHCHVELYVRMKKAATENGQIVHIGVVKDLFQFHPYKWHNLLDHFLAWQLDQLFNVQIIEFMKTGKFRFWVPFLARVSYTDSRAPACNDFIGLNYYSHYYVNLWNIIVNPDIEAKLMAKKYELMTDMPHCCYPEGLYSALVTLAKIGRPIIVTENGIADKHDDRRKLYIRRYLYAMSKAIRDGVDVIGYYYWSLMDNFEWCEGYGPRFGLYEVDFETQERTLRPGSSAFTSVVAAYNAGTIVDVRIRPKTSMEYRKPKTNTVGEAFEVEVEAEPTRLRAPV